MELNPDFINIQGILIDLDKSIGPLKKYNDRSGNEDEFYQVINKFRSILVVKHYIKNDNPNEIFNEQIRKFVLFVFLNCNIENPLEKDEYSHLTNITPPISKCLLINIMTELNLTKYLCEILEEFSVRIIDEILKETVNSLKYCNIEQYRNNAQLYLQMVIKKLSKVSLNRDIEETIESITETSAQLLLNFTVIQSNQASKLRKSTIYTHMGYNLLHIFDLLLNIGDDDNPTVSPIIQKMLSTCCSILTGVTIDVFCCWAEVDVDDQPLQSIIGEKAYNIIVHYNKNPAAKPLISMLGNIAKKPKTLNELIQQADMTTVIKMINKNDENQLKWFQALLNQYQVLSRKESIDCIKRWVHLCSKEDVRRILHLTENTRGNNYKDEAKDLAIKCASVLDVNDLITLTIAHFYRNGTDCILKEDIHQDIVLLFNKFKENIKNQDEFTKNLYLLLLQNPIKVFSYIFGECLKSRNYTPELNKILSSVKNVGEIQDLALKVLCTELEKYPPEDKHIRVYLILFDNLFEFQYFTVDKLVITAILPILENVTKDQNFAVIKPWLGILNMIRCVTLTNETKRFFEILFEIMSLCRCEFLKFDFCKQEIVKEIVELLSRYNSYNLDSSILDGGTADDPYVTFYKKKLADKSVTNLLQHYHPTYDLNNHAEVVCYLIKILPRCVKQEWLSISTTLFEQGGIEKASEIVTDVMVVLCHFIKSQINSSTNDDSNILQGLKYCLQQYGVVQEYFQRQVTDPNQDVCITKNTCRLLTEIPNERIKSETGLSLVCSLSESSFKFLKNDQKFNELVKRINDNRICQLILQKMV